MKNVSSLLKQQLDKEEIVISYVEGTFMLMRNFHQPAVGMGLTSDRLIIAPLAYTQTFPRTVSLWHDQVETVQVNAQSRLEIKIKDIYIPFVIKLSSSEQKADAEAFVAQILQTPIVHSKWSLEHRKVYAESLETLGFIGKARMYYRGIRGIENQIDALIIRRIQNQIFALRVTGIFLISTLVINIVEVLSILLGFHFNFLSNLGEFEYSWMAGLILSKDLLFSPSLRFYINHLIIILAVGSAPVIYYLITSDFLSFWSLLLMFGGSVLAFIEPHIRLKTFIALIMFIIGILLPLWFG